MPLAFWSCSSGSCPIHYWLWSTSTHSSPSTVCIPPVHYPFFCSLTGALPPHYETNNLKNFAPSISLCVRVCVCVRVPVFVFTELPTKKQQLQALNLLVLLLPDANRDTLKVDPHSEWTFSPQELFPRELLEKSSSLQLTMSFLAVLLSPRLWWSSSSVWLTIRPTTKWPSTMSPLSWHPTSSCSRGSAPRSRNSRSFQWRPARPTSSGCWLDTRIFCGRWGSKKSPLACCILPNLCQCQHSVPRLVRQS